MAGEVLSKIGFGLVLSGHVISENFYNDLLFR